MERQKFRQRIEARPTLLDGGMGTTIYERGVTDEFNFESINLEQPAVVAEIHRQFIDAGADIIETNSFSANRFKLAEHGLSHQVTAVNQAAVNIARRAIEGSFKDILLAGSVGPLGARLAPLGRVSQAEARAAFQEQIAALLNVKESGVDLLILETFSDLVEAATAVEAARSLALTIPIVVSFTYTRDDFTLLGHSAETVAGELSTLDIDGIGVNCSGGPAQVLRLLMRLRRAVPEIILLAMPNAGWPEHTTGGRVHYPATSDYFADYALKFNKAGAQLIGGCCGTTAAHIAAMKRALQSPPTTVVTLPRLEALDQGKTEATAVQAPTQLARLIESDTYVVTVEMRPPRGVSTHRLQEGAKMLQAAGANILNMADNPVAQMRMSAWAAAHLVQSQLGIETILHFPTRGRNLLRIQGDLLAAHALGIRNLFVTMGDPTRIGDYPEAMDSYDIVPTGLIQLIKQQFNAGRQHSGKTIDQPTRFAVGCALSLANPQIENELKLLRKKVLAGADFALTQPIFDPEVAVSFCKLYETTYGEPMLPLIAGIYPLYNGRNAEFLHNEVPGMVIPAPIRRRLWQAKDPQQEGVVIAQEILTAVRPLTQGVYVMPAFGRFDLAADVLDILRE